MQHDTTRTRDTERFAAVLTGLEAPFLRAIDRLFEMVNNAEQAGAQATAGSDAGTDA